jgi:hypothetical protein
MPIRGGSRFPGSCTTQAGRPLLINYKLADSRSHISSSHYGQETVRGDRCTARTTGGMSGHLITYCVTPTRVAFETAVAYARGRERADLGWRDP